MSNYDKLRQKFQSFNINEKIAFINKLSPKEKETLYQLPELFLYDKQIITGDDWRYYILLCGRAFGKTYAGSGWIYRKILDGAKTLAICGPTYGDMFGVMVPAICSWLPPNKKPFYNQKDHTLKFYNGATVWCYSSDTEVRGPNIEYLWCDEVCKWNDSIPEKVKERFEILDYAVRVGNSPQTIITTTPKPFPLLVEWKNKSQSGNLYRIQTGTMFDNPFLPKSYKEAMLNQYGGTRMGRQELYGELLEDVEGALWYGKLIDTHRVTAQHYLENVKIERVVVGVDPAVTDGTDSDSTGIVVSGIANGHAYVLADYTVKKSPDVWAREVIKAYEQFGATCIVAEQNQGGKLVELNIRTVSKNVPIKLIHAKQAKIVRAEPVAALYEQGKVHHVGAFPALENEMCTFNGNPKCKSPDRLDALVYSITELMLTQIYTNRDFSNIGIYS